MLTCLSRSALMVNDETPTSNLPDWTPGMMASKLPDIHSVLSPSLAATASKASRSQPTTVLPSAARNSLGGYDASTPTTILPSLLTAAGTMAASLGSAALVGLAGWAVSSSSFSPHAVSARAAP